MKVRDFETSLMLGPGRINELERRSGSYRVSSGPKLHESILFITIPQRRRVLILLAPPLCSFFFLGLLLMLVNHSPALPLFISIKHQTIYILQSISIITLVHQYILIMLEEQGGKNRKKKPFASC